MKLLTWWRMAAAASVMFLPQLVAAQVGLGPTPPFAGTAPGGLLSAIRTIINILLIFAALIAAIYIVIAGIRYITSRGDEDETTAAKNSILFAVIGLIVIGLSAAIVNFVIGAINGVNIGGI